MNHSRYEAARRASTRAQAKAIPIDTRKIKRQRALSWGIVVATAAVLLLMLASFANAATFKSKRGYSLAMSANWKVVKNGTMGTDLILVAPEANKFSANFNVLTRTAPRGVSLLKGRRDYEGAYSRVFNGFRWIKRGTTKVGNDAALRNVAAYQMGTPPRQIFNYQVATLHRGQLYVFTGTSLLSQRAKFEPQFDALARSIRWTK